MMVTCLVGCSDLFMVGGIFFRGLHHVQNPGDLFSIEGTGIDSLHSLHTLQAVSRVLIHLSH